MKIIHRLASALVLLLVSAGPLWAQEVENVRVTNFPKVQSIEGRVEMKTPATNTTLSALSQSVVAPVAPEETENLVPGGILDAEGFRSAVFSIAGQVKSNYPSGGIVGALLIPNTSFFKRAFEEDGQALLAVRIEAPVTSTPSAYFAGTRPRLDLAFPSYRVYFYNSTEQPVSIALYAYLAN